MNSRYSFTIVHTDARSEFEASEKRIFDYVVDLCKRFFSAQDHEEFYGDELVILVDKTNMRRHAILPAVYDTTKNSFDSVMVYNTEYLSVGCPIQNKSGVVRSVQRKLRVTTDIRGFGCSMALIWSSAHHSSEFEHLSIVEACFAMRNGQLWVCTNPYALTDVYRAIQALDREGSDIEVPTIMIE